MWFKTRPGQRTRSEDDFRPNIKFEMLLRIKTRPNQRTCSEDPFREGVMLVILGENSDFEMFLGSGELFGSPW